MNTQAIKNPTVKTSKTQKADFGKKGISISLSTTFLKNSKTYMLFMILILFVINFVPRVMGGGLLLGNHLRPGDDFYKAIPFILDFASLVIASILMGLYFIANKNKRSQNSFSKVILVGIIIVYTVFSVILDIIALSDANFTTYIDPTPDAPSFSFKTFPMIVNLLGLVAFPSIVLLIFFRIRNIFKNNK
jgi:hypothetical protein